MLVDARAFDYEPEVAFDYFGMCARLLKTNKVLFFSSPYLEPLLNTWSLGLGLEHPEAAQTHESFISNLLTIVRNDLSHVCDLEQPGLVMTEVAKVVSEAFTDIHVNEVAVWKYMLDNGGQMINKLMECILNAPSRDIVDHMIATLIVFCCNMPASYK